MDVSSIASLSSATAPMLPPGLGQPGRTARTPAEQRKAVAGQFEAIMLRQLLSQSLGAMAGGDDSTSGSIYGYLLTDVFSQKLAQSGGMGLASVIEKQLTPRGTPVVDPGEGSTL
jgi:Rod binding domain-containing protein